MGFSREKRRSFVAAMGEERVRQLEERLFGLSRELEERGVAFKDVITHVEGKLMTEIEKGIPPARYLINDLMAQRPADSKAAKALRETRQPGAAYAADVLDGRMIRG